MDYSKIGSAFVVMAVLSALGIGIDSLLLKRQRTKLGELLSQWWDYVDQLLPRDIVKDMCELFLDAEEWVFGPQVGSRRWFLMATAISVVITTAAIVVGEAMYLARMSDMSWLPATLSALGYMPHHNPLLIYPTNLLFDAVTFLATIWLIRLAAASPSILVRLGLFLLDAILALGFAFICFVMSIRIENASENVNIELRGAGFGVSDLGVNSHSLSYFLEYFRFILDFIFGWTSETGAANILADFLYANTSLFPTLAYLAILLLLAISMGVIRTARMFSKHILNLARENDKSVFYYTATLVGVIQLSARLLLEFIMMLHQLSA